MTGGKLLLEEELRTLAIKEMDNYIDMGCFRYPEVARPYLIDGFELGYKMAMKSDEEPEYCTCRHISEAKSPGYVCLICGKSGKEE